jgi:hypothetical protein
MDTEALRRAAADLPPQIRLLAELDRPHDSYESLVGALLRSGDPEAPLWTVELLDAVLDGRSERTVPGPLEIKQPYVHHGDLTVEGHLSIVAPFVVTGSLDVAGVVDDTGPDSVVGIGGDLTCQALDTDGEFQVGGTIGASVVHGYYNDNSLIAEQIQARLVIADDHDVQADVDADLYLDIDDYAQGYGVGVQEQLREVLVDEIFEPGEDGVQRMSRELLFDRIRAGLPVFR